MASNRNVRMARSTSDSPIGDQSFRAPIVCPAAKRSETTEATRSRGAVLMAFSLRGKRVRAGPAEGGQESVGCPNEPCDPAGPPETSRPAPILRTAAPSCKSTLWKKPGDESQDPRASEAACVTSQPRRRARGKSPPTGFPRRAVLGLEWVPGNAVVVPHSHQRGTDG